MDRDAVNRAIGLHLRALRKHRGVTQAELAEKIGRASETISHIERGVSALLPETAFSIAQVLGLELADMYRVNLPSEDTRADVRRYLSEIAAFMQDHEPEERERIFRIFKEVFAYTNHQSKGG